MKIDIRSKIIQKVTILGAIVNLLLSIIKIFIGHIGGSGALVADGVHSLSDLLSDWIIWYAAKKAGKSPDAEHPYGHEKFESIATLGVSILLALIGIGIIINAINNLSSPVELSYTNWLLAITIISILSKELLYWYTILVAKKTKSDMLKANAWHHRTDSLSSIIVLIGIYGAMNGYIYLDTIAAILIGLMIIFIAYKLGFKTTKELVDTSINAKELTKLKKNIKKIDGIEGIHCLRTRINGQKISADLHIQVAPFISVSEGHVISIYVEKVAKKSIQGLTDITVHIDPEDDQKYISYPERKKVIQDIEKNLAKKNCKYKINLIKLHYLAGNILVDCYIDIKYLNTEKAQDIQNKISTIILEIKNCNNVEVYFS